MTDRDRILGAIVDRPSTLDVSPVPFVASTDEMWTQFESQLRALGGRVIDQREFDKLSAQPRWSDPVLGLPNSAGSIWDAEVGFSLAVRAVAQTGSLVLVNVGGETERLSSVVPPVNVIVCAREAIVADLAQAVKDLPRGNIVIVTGPSRTADIEGVLVRGVHGPGELLVFVRES